MARTALVVLLALTGCAQFGDAVEANCIKGQLSAAQAASLKPEEFETHPSYCAGREDEHGKNGDVHCQPEIYDRVLAAHCSYALKEFEK